MRRDLEAEFLLVTSDENLKHELKKVLSMKIIDISNLSKILNIYLRKMTDNLNNIFLIR